MVAFAHTTYVKWVQRSINYYFADCRLPIDGLITADYRAAVVDVQFEHYLTESGDVNSPTQNALIKANHDSREYTSWVQKHLNALLGKSLGSSIIDSPTRAAIKDFQDAFSKSYSGGLVKDGWFGYKTELVMIELTKDQPPTRCFVFPDEPITGTRKCIVRRLPGLKGLKTGNALADCMIKKVLDPKSNTDYMDLSLAIGAHGAPLGSASASDTIVDLRQQFKDTVARRKKVGLKPLTCKEAEAWFVGKASDLLSGIQGVLVADPLHPIIPQLRKMIHKWSMDRTSLYRCPAALDAVNRMLDKVGKNGLGIYTYRGSVS